MTPELSEALAALVNNVNDGLIPVCMAIMLYLILTRIGIL